MEGDERGFRIAVCADALVNPEPGGLDALAVCARAGFGVMQLPATWYPEEVAAGWLEQVAEQLDEYLRHGYVVVLVTRAGDADGPRQRAALAAALAAIGHGLPPEHESDGDADALEAFLRSQPVPGATA
jgi:DNA-binding transcriptional LysR family regulator